MALAPEALRDANSRNGINGLATRACRATKATSRATATAPSPIVRAEVQPTEDTCRMVKTPSIRPAISRTAPTTSAPWPRPSAGLVLDQPHGQPRRSPRPTGRLMKKIQCQLIAEVSTPPASRPIEPPADATKP